MLKSFVALTALAAAGVAQAGVVTLFSDDFESDTPALAVTSLTNWTVTGNVDVVGMPNGFGITCTGNCVDLDGTRGEGILVSRSIAFAAGGPVTISYDLSGSQRSAASDSFLFGVDFASPIFASNVSWIQPDSSSPPFFTQLSSEVFFADVSGTMGWGTFSFSFTPETDGAMTLGFLTGSADNIGPLIDNVLVTQGVIPEPATWAMLIAGFGLVGTAMRRRRTAVAA